MARPLPAAKQAGQPTAALTRRRVVIADDSDIARALIERLLADDPSLQVVGRARSGAELLNLPALRAADVVVLDLVMPELAGLSVLSQLPKRCRAVAISGAEAGSALARAALAEGASCYISKRELRGPDGAQNLQALVHQALQSLMSGRPSAEARTMAAAGGCSGPLEISGSGSASHLKRRVVIADDSELAAALLENLLEGDPRLQVIGHAQNGQQLLDLPALAAADVVLLDLVMPDVAGLSVLSRLPDRCRVIAVSGDPKDSPLARAALGHGARQYISKRDLRGADAAQRLRAVVHAVLGSSPAVERPARPRPVPALPQAASRIVPLTGSAGAVGLRPRSVLSGKRRVVVADDSETAMALLEELLRHDPNIEVVGRARSGAELLELQALELADVVLLDLVMPDIGGLSALPRLVGHCAVVAVSGERQDSALAKAAVNQGAREYVSKQDLGGADAAHRLCAAIRTATPGCSRAERPVLLVAGSTGAVRLLTSLLEELQDLELPTLVVQHLPPGRQGALADLIAWSGTRVQVATHGARLEPGVMVAPTGRHLTLSPRLRIALVDAPPVNGFCPSADVLFESAVPLGRRAVAVMLSGLGNDGARGMGHIADTGGLCLAIEPAECLASQMPRAALAASRRVIACRIGDLAPTIRSEAACRFHGFEDQAPQTSFDTGPTPAADASG